MKIFDKFTLSDKRNELVIKYTDCEMTGGYGTIVLNLKDVREGRVTLADVEDSCPTSRTSVTLRYETHSLS